jgi:hypothetical protein
MPAKRTEMRENVNQVPSVVKNHRWGNNQGYPIGYEIYPVVYDWIVATSETIRNFGQNLHRSAPEPKT